MSFLLRHFSLGQIGTLDKSKTIKSMKTNRTNVWDIFWSYNVILLDSRLHRFQTWAETWIGFTPVLFFGRGVFQYNYGIIPRRKKITVVVGKPLEVAKVENPSREEIADLHARYVQAVTDLYQEYNPIYGDENIKLIVE